MRTIERSNRKLFPERLFIKKLSLLSGIQDGDVGCEKPTSDFYEKNRDVIIDNELTELLSYQWENVACEICERLDEEDKMLICLRSVDLFVEILNKSESKQFFYSSKTKKNQINPAGATRASTQIA